MNRAYILFFSIVLLSCSYPTNDTNIASDKIKHNSENSGDSLNYAESVDSLILNYWNNFDFKNYNKVSQAPLGEQALVDFINLFPKAKPWNIGGAIDSLILHSSVNKKSQSYFEDLLERYLYNVNSPQYNERYYSIVLEKFMHSLHIENDKKNKYRIIYKLINRNNVGDIATDFNYYSKKESSLHQLNANYLILYFYAPDCSSCQQSFQTLKNNPNILAFINAKARTLAIYAEGNKQLWEGYAQNIPKEWINGVDLNQNIIKKGLYDLKATPTLYLLDSNKRVLLKDVSLAELIAYLQRV